MSSYQSKFLGMFARSRQSHQARLLHAANDQVGGQVTTRSQAHLPARAANIEPEEAAASEPEEQNEIENNKENYQPPTKRLKRNDNEEPTLFNSETLVAENESLEAYVVKSFLKRQIRFR